MIQEILEEKTTQEIQEDLMIQEIQEEKMTQEIQEDQVIQRKMVLQTQVVQPILLNQMSQASQTDQNQESQMTKMLPQKKLEMKLNLKESKSVLWKIVMAQKKW